MHVYFERQGNIHSGIFTRVTDIVTGQDLGGTHTFSVKEASIMEQVTSCQTKLLGMIEKQMSYFKRLSAQCHEIDHDLALSNQQLFTASTDEKNSIILTSIRISENYVALLDELTLHSNYPLERSIYIGKKSYLKQLIHRLQNRLTEAESSSLLSSSMVLPDEKTEWNDSLILVPPLSVLKKTRCEDKKQELSNMIDLFLATSETDSKVTYLAGWRQIDDGFLELELTYAPKHVQDFITAQRARLPAVDLYHFFLMLCKTAPIDHVGQIYPSVVCKIDMMNLFAEIHQKIMSKDEAMENLIQVADFLYEHSTDYQAYMLVKMRTFCQCNESLVHLISPLILSCTTNNFPVFQMYLRQGCSIHSAHMFEGDIALNALQVIVLLSNTLIEQMSITTLKCYVSSLFEHGAKLITPVLLDAHTNHLIPLNTTKDISDLVKMVKDKHRDGRVVESSRRLEKGRNAGIHERKHHPSIAKSLSKHQVILSCNRETLQRVSQIPDILQLSVILGLHQTYHHEIIEQIASYADLKPCLNAMLILLNQGCFIRLLSTYHEGKITCFKATEEMSAYIDECQKGPHDRFNTFQFVYGFNNSELPEQLNKDDIMLKLHYLIQRFQALYFPLPDKSKRELIKELKSEAIKAQLDKKDHISRLVAMEAVFLALTCIAEPTPDDFLQVVKISILSLKLSLEFVDITNNGYVDLCGILYDKLGRLIDNMPIDTQQKILPLRDFIWLKNIANQRPSVFRLSFFPLSPEYSLVIEELPSSQGAADDMPAGGGQLKKGH